MFALDTEMLRDIPQNGPTDPIAYYRKPLIGSLYRKRINLGFELLPEKRFARALEIGYGAGAVLLALAPGVDNLAGIDLDADPEPVARLLERHGQRAALERGTVYELPFTDGSFDLVVSFSVFEHLKDYRKALGEVRRVLAPGGVFLLGMPSVNRMMEVAFLAIGFKGIDDHHVTTPAEVAAAFPESGFRLKRASFLDFPRPFPLGLRLYHHFLLETINVD